MMGTPLWLQAVFWTAVALIAYAYRGYRLTLELLVRFSGARRRRWPEASALPLVSVIVPVFDEQDVVAERIRDLLALDYPRDRLEIIVASDGSTDGTVAIAKTFEPEGVRVVAYGENRGRAAMHNETVPVAAGEIVVFTDADTAFDAAFVAEIVRPFADPVVGAAIGRLCYRGQDRVVGRAEEFYWSEELRIKDLEDRLGILNNGTGACMALRKGLFRPLRGVDDVDTGTVMDLLFSGFRVAYVPSAVAYDTPPQTAAGEFRMRVRGTSKTVASVFGRVPFAAWLRRPVLTWSIASHRGLRYGTPFLMILALGTNVLLAFDRAAYSIVLAGHLLFYALAFLGWIASLSQTTLPVASLAYSFNVAAAGMMVGVVRAVVGRAPSSYRPAE